MASVTLIQTALQDWFCLRPQGSPGDHQVINTKERKKICKNYLNHSISILSDNYHLSIEKEAEMKEESQWSHVCMKHSNNVWNFLWSDFFFFPFFPPYFQHGGENSNKWEVEKSPASEPTHSHRLEAGIWTMAEGGRLHRLKRKGSFHGGRLLDS